MRQVIEHEKSQSDLYTQHSLTLRETPKILQFAMFHSILEFDEGVCCSRQRAQGAVEKMASGIRAEGEA